MTSLLIVFSYVFLIAHAAACSEHPLRPPRTKFQSSLQLEVQETEVALHDLLKRCAASDEVRAVVLAPHSQARQPEFSEARTDRKRLERLVPKILSRVEAGLSTSEWFVGLKPVTLENRWFEFKETEISLLVVEVPGFQPTDLRKHANLFVYFWFCSDALTARACFLTRSGKQVVLRETGAALETIEARYTDFPVDISRASCGYRFRHDLIYNAVSFEGDGNVGNDRLGFLLEDIIVEFATHSFDRGAKDEVRWRKIGIDQKDEEQLVLAFSVIGSFLKDPANRRDGE